MERKGKRKRRKGFDSGQVCDMSLASLSVRSAVVSLHRNVMGESVDLVEVSSRSARKREMFLKLRT